MLITSGPNIAARVRLREGYVLLHEAFLPSLRKAAAGKLNLLSSMIQCKKTFLLDVCR